MTQNWGPRKWGDDRLSEFLKRAENNKWAVFERTQAEWKTSLEIDQTYSKAFDALAYPEDEFVVLLFARGMPVWRQAISLTISGALIEGYAVLRLFIEYVFYAVYLRKNPTKIKAWARRDDDTLTLKLFKKDFVHKVMFDEIPNIIGKKNTSALNQLYDKAISFGGHPNVSAFIVNSLVERKPEQTRALMVGLQADLSLIKPVIDDINFAGKLGLRALLKCYTTRLRIAEIEDLIDRVAA